MRIKDSPRRVSVFYKKPPRRGHRPMGNQETWRRTREEGGSQKGGWKSFHGLPLCQRHWAVVIYPHVGFKVQIGNRLLILFPQSHSLRGSRLKKNAGRGEGQLGLAHQMRYEGIRDKPCLAERSALFAFPPLSSPWPEVFSTDLLSDALGGGGGGGESVIQSSVCWNWKPLYYREHKRKHLARLSPSDAAPPAPLRRHNWI